MKKVNVLITGVSGFVGRNLVKNIINDYHVIGLDIKKLDFNHDNFKFISMDLSKININSLPKDIDIIIHLASVVGNKGFEEDALNSFNINVISTLKLLEYGKRESLKKFIFASTGGVYGYRSDAVTENDQVNPDNFYALSKYFSEKLIPMYKDYFKYSILRLYFPYGFGQEENRFIPSLIRRVMTGEQIKVYNDNQPVVSSIYIGDLVEVIKKVMTTGDNEIFNIASDECKSITKICSEIGNILGIKPEYKKITNSKVQNIVADISKAKKQLNFKTKYTLKEYFKEYIVKKRIGE